MPYKAKRCTMPHLHDAPSKEKSKNDELVMSMNVGKVPTAGANRCLCLHIILGFPSRRSTKTARSRTMKWPRIVWCAQRNPADGWALSHSMAHSSFGGALSHGHSTFGTGVMYEINTTGLRMEHVEGNEYRIKDVVPKGNIRRVTQFQDDVSTEIAKYERHCREDEEDEEDEDFYTCQRYQDEEDAQEEADENDFIEYMQNH